MVGDSAAELSDEFVDDGESEDDRELDGADEFSDGGISAELSEGELGFEEDDYEFDEDEFDEEDKK